ncbi:MAG: DUF2254 family protein [Pseudonocardiaceae bacterium]
MAWSLNPAPQESSTSVAAADDAHRTHWQIVLRCGAVKIEDTGRRNGARMGVHGFGNETSARREALRTQLWPLPTFAVVLAVVMGVGLPRLDIQIADALPTTLTAYLFGGGPGAARTVLSAIASSLITVTSLTFSLTVVTLQLASGQFSPRLLRTFTPGSGPRPTGRRQRQHRFRDLRHCRLPHCPADHPVIRLAEGPARSAMQIRSGYYVCSAALLLTGLVGCGGATVAAWTRVSCARTPPGSQRRCGDYTIAVNEAPGETALRKPDSGLLATTSTAITTTAATAATQRLLSSQIKRAGGRSAEPSGSRGSDTTARPASGPEGAPVLSP